MVASVPVETRRIFSIGATTPVAVVTLMRSRTSSASSVSAGGGRPERQPPCGGSLHGLDHARVRVPENRRTPRADQIHVFATLGVGDVGP